MDEQKTPQEAPERENAEEPNYNAKCPACGEPLPDTLAVCPVCGARLRPHERRYTPISEKKARVIRWIVGAVCLVGFVLIYVFVLKK